MPFSTSLCIRFFRINCCFLDKRASALVRHILVTEFKCGGTIYLEILIRWSWLCLNPEHISPREVRTGRHSTCRRNPAAACRRCRSCSPSTMPRHRQCCTKAWQHTGHWLHPAAVAKSWQLTSSNAEHEQLQVFANLPIIWILKKIDERVFLDSY